jgi:hypothetical protein
MQDYFPAFRPDSYLITLTWYGTHLYGSRKGWVTRDHNQYGTPTLPANEALATRQRTNLTRDPIRLEPKERKIALNEILTICKRQEWRPLAVHVRSSHFHSVIRAERDPESIIAELRAGLDESLRSASLRLFGYPRICTRGGSRRYLWKSKDTLAAVDYVANCQGRPMELYVDPDYREWVQEAARCREKVPVLRRRWRD